MSEQDQPSLMLLRDSLAEAATTVRAYDTKAQIVGVGYIFALGIVQQIGALVPPSTTAVPGALVVVGWVVVVLPIVLFGMVLYPTRKTAPGVGGKVSAGLQRVLYVEPERHPSVEALQAAVARADPVTEYAFELRKVAELRELKRQRFLRALFAAGVAFLLLFLSQLGRSLNGFPN